MLHIYQSLGYPVFSVSTQQADSTHDAAAVFCATKRLGDCWAIGVGKSSLIRALLPDIDIAVGELSAGVEKGQATPPPPRVCTIYPKVAI
jgi:putative ribosome biogenesis GTPase RsgA